MKIGWRYVLWNNIRAKLNKRLKMSWVDPGLLPLPVVTILSTVEWSMIVRIKLWLQAVMVTGLWIADVWSEVPYLEDIIIRG